MATKTNQTHSPLSDPNRYFCGQRGCLLDYLQQFKFRHCTSFNTERQLEFAKKIILVEDSEARKIMSDLLREASYLHGVIEKAKGEIESLHTTLVAIDKELSKDAS